MTVWEEFEINCTQYLNKNFGEFAKFTHLGSSNSTVADIKVETKNKTNFYIEAKHSPAQCGQFVLLPNLKEQKFEYSNKNVVPINEFSQKIINFMNGHFEKFKNAGTSGEKIEFPNCSKIFAEWIVLYYKSKGVKFFITNNYTIFPIEKFLEFFDVSAIYRIKRSGSSPVGHAKINQIKTYITQNYATNEVKVVGGKIFVLSDAELHNKRFVLSGNEYMFSKRRNEYEVRKLSNTFNANVIFSISLKPNKQGISKSDFILILVGKFR